jgi:mannose-6-phosphate isomerase-like protein (cupin superfamily)
MGAPVTFDELMAPLGAETFVRDYLGKQPLHLEGAAEKFQEVMSWDILNRLLGMTTIWASASLQLFLDKEPIPFAQYCAAAPGRDGGQVLRPQPDAVKGLLKRGATMVLNDIDQLTPELSALSRAMEQTLGGNAQGNLYLSSKRKQGFKAHFDTHDVFAVHCAGEKVWAVFEGRADHPIAHPMFKSLGQEHHEQAKGKLWKEVRLKPGDLLYIPRGQYHYALADDGACMHIAMGMTYHIGLDFVTYMFERMVAEPLARQNLPHRDPAALAERLAALGRRMAEIAAQPATRDDIARLTASFRYPRDSYDLPGLVDGTAEEAFAVRADGIRLVEQGGRYGLVKAGSREAVEVPAPIKDLVGWVLDRPGFARHELAARFHALPPAAIDKFLADMQRMRLIEPRL